MSTTMSKYGASINRPLSEIVGLSTDVIPQIKLKVFRYRMALHFFEMGTNKKYCFDIESKQWNLVDGSGGGGSATLIEKSITENGTYIAANDDAMCGMTYQNIGVYTDDQPYEQTGNGLHPNAAGMSLIANNCIRTMDASTRIRY